MECRRSGQDARGVVSSAGGERRSVQVTWMTLGVRMKFFEWRSGWSGRDRI